jgi:hypothetical protein
MHHTMISCLREKEYKMEMETEKEHLMPDTASLSPAERMMLLEWLNFLLIFLTPFGSFSAMHLTNIRLPDSLANTILAPKFYQLLCRTSANGLDKDIT